MFQLGTTQDLFIPWAKYWYNTSFQGAARITPFEVVYCRPSPSLSRFILGETAVEAMAQDLMTRDERGFPFITFFDSNLIVPTLQVYFGKYGCTM